MTLLLALALALPPPKARVEEPRVIVVSFDGAGYAMTSRLVAEGKLPNFGRLLREGAWSDGMVTSFPTKTAAAHALLFTGQHGHTSGITGNSLLQVPPESGSRLQTMNGYFSDALRVEPVWATAARAGRDAYVLHAPQLYPFRPLPRLYAAHGYTGANVPADVLRPEEVPPRPPGASWTAPEARGEEAREIRFSVGESPFLGLFFDDPIDPTEGCDTLGVALETDLSEFVARVKAGDEERFSAPVAARVKGKDAWFSLRLFTVAPDASSFVLFRTGAAEMAVSRSDFPGFGLHALEAYSGNAGTRAYSDGRFGRTLAQGGSGRAERFFLETESHLVSQLIAQARLVLTEDYRLVVLYSPVTDEVVHELGGYLEPGLGGYDEGLASKLWPVVAAAFGLQDRFLGVILEAAERDSAHVLVVSDHGMAGTDKLVYLNVALARAGLLTLTSDRSVDLSRTRALAPPLADASVAVNAVDRPGGVVALSERQAVLLEARRALEAIVDPLSGEGVVTGFFEPSTEGLLQPGGSSTGELFLDFAPGYYPSTDTGRDLVIESVEPRGNHIFVPTRRDMLALFAAFGPRIPAGTSFGRVRALDVAPTILDLLDLEAATGLPGRSLVPHRGILHRIPNLGARAIVLEP